MMMMRKVALSLVFLATTSAHADVILYQTSFDTDTTDVPGTYAPLDFNSAGYEHDPAINSSTPTDSTAFVEAGVLHIRRGLTGGAASVPFTRPELTLSSQDLLGTSQFPSQFSISLEMGGTPGNASWWGTMIKMDDRTHADVVYGFHPGIGYSNFGINNVPVGDITWTTATDQFTAQFDTMYLMGISVTDLGDSYQFDLSVTDPDTGNIYLDSAAIAYPYPITTIGIGRWGPGGGDSIFDNLSVSTPVPEPSTGLLLATGLLGLGVNRRRAPRSDGRVS